MFTNVLKITIFCNNNLNFLQWNFRGAVSVGPYVRGGAWANVPHIHSLLYLLIISTMFICLCACFHLYMHIIKLCVYVFILLCLRVGNVYIFMYLYTV